MITYWARVTSTLEPVTGKVRRWGSRALVLDPFAGTATTCLVAQRLGRRAVGVDLSEAYLQQAVKRLEGVTLPLGMRL